MATPPTTKEDRAMTPEQQKRIRRMERQAAFLQGFTLGLIALLIWQLV